MQNFCSLQCLLQRIPSSTSAIVCCVVYLFPFCYRSMKIFHEMLLHGSWQNLLCCLLRTMILQWFMQVLLRSFLFWCHQINYTRFCQVFGVTKTSPSQSWFWSGVQWMCRSRINVIYVTKVLHSHFFWTNIRSLKKPVHHELKSILYKDYEVYEITWKRSVP